MLALDKRHNTGKESNIPDEFSFIFDLAGDGIDHDRLTFLRSAEENSCLRIHKLINILNLTK